MKRNHRYKQKPDAYTSRIDFIAVLSIILTLVFVLIATAIPIAKCTFKRNEIGTVITKEYDETKDNYIIKVETDNGFYIYQIEDNLFFDIDNSRQIYNNITVGNRYNFLVSGLYIDLFDVYPIVLDINETK